MYSDYDIGLMGEPKCGELTSFTTLNFNKRTIVYQVHHLFSSLNLNKRTKVPLHHQCLEDEETQIWMRKIPGRRREVDRQKQTDKQTERYRTDRTETEREAKIKNVCH